MSAGAAVPVAAARCGAPRETSSPGLAPLLHNMSARPRTTVTCTVRPLRSQWVSFGWSAPPVLDDSLRAALDDLWAVSGFSGAALVFALTTELRAEISAAGSIHRCSDRLLTCNVLLRVRGTLLLADMPLLGSAEWVGRRTVATDDPRLLRLAWGAR